MATDADITPIVQLDPMDQLLLDMSVLKANTDQVMRGLSSLSAIESHCERTANTQLKMYAHQQREGIRLRLAIGTCVACALICVACTLVTYTKFASAAVRIERPPGVVRP